MTHHLGTDGKARNQDCCQDKLRFTYQHPNKKMPEHQVGYPEGAATPSCWSKTWCNITLYHWPSQEARRLSLHHYPVAKHRYCCNQPQVNSMSTTTLSPRHGYRAATFHIMGLPAAMLISDSLRTEHSVHYFVVNINCNDVRTKSSSTVLSADMKMANTQAPIQNHILPV